MDDEMIRLECLKMADGNVDRAEDMFQFVKRRGEFAASPTMTGYTGNPTSSKARIVGRDGDVPGFEDYLKD